MKIICECDGVGFVESENVEQVELSLYGGSIRAILFEHAVYAAHPSRIIVYSSEANAVLYLPKEDWLLEIIKGDNERVPIQIFLSKDHPSFNQVIDAVKLQQTLS